jgi:hypothetical protein
MEKEAQTPGVGDPGYSLSLNAPIGRPKTRLQLKTGPESAFLSRVHAVESEESSVQSQTKR